CVSFPESSPTRRFTLSLHDALPILAVCIDVADVTGVQPAGGVERFRRRFGIVEVAGHHLGAPNQQLASFARSQVSAGRGVDDPADRKSTRLNSSHVSISYAVFCLKK